jgi:hypothetical protein
LPKAIPFDTWCQRLPKTDCFDTWAWGLLQLIVTETNGHPFPSVTQCALPSFEADPVKDRQLAAGGTREQVLTSNRSVAWFAVASASMELFARCGVSASMSERGTQ